MCGTFATLKLYRTTLQSVPMFDAGFIALDIFPTSGLKFPIRIHRLHIHYQMGLRKHGRCEMGRPKKHTPPKINIEPENYGLEDDFPFQ